MSGPSLSRFVGWRARIGLVIPSNNTVIEPELYAMAPAGVTIHASRILSCGPSPQGIIEMERSADRALGELRAGGLTTLVYACLATSFVKGRDWTEGFNRRLAGESAAITAAEAIFSTLKFLAATRITIATAYPSRINDLIPAFFKSYGFDVAKISSLEIADSSQLWRISQEDIWALGKMALASATDALCFLGTDIPTAGVLEPMEARFGLPVIATNQAILFRALAECGVDEPIAGYGSLLRLRRVIS